MTSSDSHAEFKEFEQNRMFKVTSKEGVLGVVWAVLAIVRKKPKTLKIR